MNSTDSYMCTSSSMFTFCHIANYDSKGENKFCCTRENSAFESKENFDISSSLFGILTDKNSSLEIKLNCSVTTF